jgi:hypothetical protein
MTDVLTTRRFALSPEEAIEAARRSVEVMRLHIPPSDAQRAGYVDPMEGCEAPGRIEPRESVWRAVLAGLGPWGEPYTCPYLDCGPAAVLDDDRLRACWPVFVEARWARLARRYAGKHAAGPQR